MSDREAFRRVLPNKRNDWRKLTILASFLLITLLAVVVILIHKHSFQEYIEQTWASSIGTVEDARITPMTNSGRVMTYQVEVLMTYPINGVSQQRWVHIEQQPKSHIEAELQIFRWRGNKCVVRWNPSHPEQVIAELN